MFSNQCNEIIFEGTTDWDTSAYNQIIVKETADFIDEHLRNESTSDTPFFAYMPLGAAHQPHSPPYKYFDEEPIAGTYPNHHMDILSELDMVVGSTMEILEEKGVLNDTIVIFTSDNGGVKSLSADYDHHTSGPLRDAKGSIHEGGHRIPL